MTVADPTLRVERKLHREGVEFVIGCDEVGRGAIAGPVAVGVSLVDHRMRRVPAGLRDSKMLSEPRREELAPLARRWVRYWAVGLASADRDRRARDHVPPSRLAGRRAMTELVARGRAGRGVGRAAGRQPRLADPRVARGGGPAEALPGCRPASRPTATAHPSPPLP